MLKQTRSKIVVALSAAFNVAATEPRRRHNAPPLKRPRTPHDFAMIAKAQAKRERKAAKRLRDSGHCAAGTRYAHQQIIRRSVARQHDSRVRAEALDVARELEAEQLA